MRVAQAAWPPPRAAEPPPPVMGPRVILRADNPNVRLQQHTQLRWRDVCLAPCGGAVDPSALYRIGGGTAIASAPFPLPRASGEVYVDAQVGSKVKHWVGLGVMIGGAVAAGYGFLFWETSQGFNSAGGNDNFPRNLAIFCFGVGAVLEAVGLPMFFSDTTAAVQ